MRGLLKGALVAAALLIAAPAFAQVYFGGPGFSFGFGYPDGDYYGPGYYGPDYYPPEYSPPPPPPVYEGGRAEVDPGAVEYCERHFRSYNPATGLYLGYDGLYHPCP